MSARQLLSVLIASAAIAVAGISMAFAAGEGDNGPSDQQQERDWTQERQEETRRQGEDVEEWGEQRGEDVEQWSEERGEDVEQWSEQSDDMQRTAMENEQQQRNQQQDMQQQMQREQEMQQPGREEMEQPDQMQPPPEDQMEQPLMQRIMMAPSPAGWMIEQKEALDLSEDQLSRLEQIDSDFQEQNTQLREEFKQKMQEARGRIEGESDPEQVRSDLQEISDAGIDMVIAWIESRNQAMDVLDPDQQQIASAMLGGQPSESVG